MNGVGSIGVSVAFVVMMSENREESSSNLSRPPASEEKRHHPSEAPLKLPGTKHHTVNLPPFASNLILIVSCFSEKTLS